MFNLMYVFIKGVGLMAAKPDWAEPRDHVHVFYGVSMRMLSTMMHPEEGRKSVAVFI